MNLSRNEDSGNISLGRNSLAKWIWPPSFWGEISPGEEILEVFLEDEVPPGENTREMSLRNEISPGKWIQESRSGNRKK